MRVEGNGNDDSAQNVRKSKELQTESASVVLAFRSGLVNSPCSTGSCHPRRQWTSCFLNQRSACLALLFVSSNTTRIRGVWKTSRYTLDHRSTFVVITIAMQTRSYAFPDAGTSMEVSPSFGMHFSCWDRFIHDPTSMGAFNDVLLRSTALTHAESAEGQGTAHWFVLHLVGDRSAAQSALRTATWHVSVRHLAVRDY